MWGEEEEDAGVWGRGWPGGGLRDWGGVGDDGAWSLLRLSLSSAGRRATPGVLTE